MDVLTATMDIEMLLVGALVIVLTAGAVYFMSLFGTREKSFEEAIAEQKQNQLSEQLLGRPSGKSGNKDKKKNPGANNNANNKSQKKAQTQGQQAKKQKLDHQKRKPSQADLEIETEAETFEVKAEEKRVEENKEELSLPSTEEALIEEVTEALEVKAQNLNQNGSDKAPAPAPRSKPPRKKGKEVVAAPAVAEVVIAGNIEVIEPVAEAKPVAVLEESANKSGGGKVKPARKGQKSPQGQGSGGPDLSANQLEEALSKAHLSSSDIQTLTDILLNKQQRGDSDWINKSKSDTLSTLKKQLSEKEQQSANDTATIQTLHSKVKELRAEFTSEKSLFNSIRKQLEDTTNAKKNEVQQLQVRLQKVSDTALEEKNQLQQLLHQNQGTLKALQQENAGIKTALANLEKESHGKTATVEKEDSMREEYSKLENQMAVTMQSYNEIVSQNQTLQHQLRSLEELKAREEASVHEGYATQIREREEHLVSELNKSQALATEMERRNAGLEQEICSNKSSITELRKTATEAEKKYLDAVKTEKDAVLSLKDSKNRLTDLENKLSCTDSLVQNLKAENQHLEAQVLSLTEKQSGGAVVKDDSHKLRQELVELQQRLSQYEGKVQSLDTDKKNLMNDSETSKLDLKAQNEKNEELVRTANKLSEALKAAESKIESLTSQAEIQTKEVVGVTRQQCEVELKNTFKTLFPDAKIPDQGDWKKNFAANIQEKLQANAAAVSSSKKEDDEVVKRLNDEVKTYQAQLKAAEERLAAEETAATNKNNDWQARLDAQIAETTQAKTNAQVLVDNCRKETELELQHGLMELLPGIAFEKTDDWRKNFAETVTEKLKLNSASTEEISELSSKVKHYEATLESKEAILKSLSTTESELRTKLEKVEAELNAAKVKAANIISNPELLINGQHNLQSPAKETNGVSSDLSHGSHSPSKSTTPEPPAPSSPQLSSPGSATGTDPSKDKEKKKKKGASKAKGKVD